MIGNSLFSLLSKDDSSMVVEVWTMSINPRYVCNGIVFYSDCKQVV